MNTSSYAIILAGGSGTRFWPLSRNTKPKQLLPLFGEQTLLQRAIKRLEGLIPVENILILTNPAQEEEVRKQATQLPWQNIIAEPCRRDTAPAVALGIGLVAARNPEATMLIIPSDQLIQDEDKFRHLMDDTLNVATHNNVLMTIGIKPTWACPSYGYIERGSPATLNHKGTMNTTCYKVTRFCEKPSPTVAAQFIEEGNFSWNAGMFVWSVPSARRQLQEHAPELEQFIKTLIDHQANPVTIAANFPTLTPISIDFALMEKADNVYNVEASFDWDDVGSWISVAKYLEQEQGNSTNTCLSSLNSTGNIVFQDGSKKRVALLGVDNLIIVDTGDALLIADKTQADAIKNIVKDLPESLV